MGDCLKLSKDKRHRSSSSIAGAGLDGTRSERKLDIRGFIPEVDDHFAIAESRCEELQEKIDVVKLLKRKKKLNKRSVTRVNEVPTVSENVPFISVRTQPKKRLMVTEVSQQGARTRRMEAPNVARGYVDPATVEQHRMLGQVWGYGQNYNHQNEYHSEQKQFTKSRPRRNRADGDGMCGQTLDCVSAPTEVACGQEDDASAYTDAEVYDSNPGDIFPETANTNIFTMKKRKSLPRKNEPVNDKTSNETMSFQYRPAWKNSPAPRRRTKLQQQDTIQQQQQQNVQQNSGLNPNEERPVVELFNKSHSRNSSPPIPRPKRPVPKKEEKRIRKISVNQDGQQNVLNAAASDVSFPSLKKSPVRRKLRNRNYEMPTVASQLKHADARYHCAVANCSNIPFVVSKSTAPSHNIGVNIQQVLNGVKMQQPVNGIPMTIAHHMGLGHVPSYKRPNKPPKPSLNKGVINVINMGRRMLTLPSYRSISYNRLLSMYREGDGMVPRFLRAISRPNYIYTSMYDLAHREDVDIASTKGRAIDREGPSSVDEDTKRRLAEYADIYAEYEKVDALRQQGGHGSVEAERRCDELLRELLAREEIIKQLMDKGNGVPATLNSNEMRASAAAINEARRTKRDQS